MDPQLVWMVGAIFVSIAAATAAVVWFLTDPQLAQRRLSQIAPERATRAREPVSLVGDDVSEIAKRVRSVRARSRRRTWAGSSACWRAPATTAPGRQHCTPSCSWLTPILFGGAVIYFFGWATSVLVFAGLAAALGYYLPDVWLGRAIERRRKQISDGLPDAIDLLIVCIESGSGIDQALSRVGEELAIAYPALSAEIELIAAETRAGKPRLDAFRNFADRTKVEDVRSLVNMLIQTDKFGTSIGQALRTHAEVSRTKRRQRAEEKAAKLGVKMLFPLVFCIFPAFYLVVIGPSMLRIFRQFVWGSV